MVQSASASSDNHAECYIEGRAQSVVGFGLETHTLRLCAPPGHTIRWEVANQQYQNGPMDTESVSKCFDLLRQPFQVLYRGSCTIGCRLRARNTHFEGVCSSSAHDSLEVPNQQYQNGPMDMESVPKCFDLLRQPIQVLYRGSCTIGCRLWARNTHVEGVCSSSAHDSGRGT